MNYIPCCTVAPIKLQEVGTDDSMVFLQGKGIQQPSRNIPLQGAAYDAMRKQIVMPIREMKRECMMKLHEKKVRLENDVTTKNNPDSILRIYPTIAKISQCILVAENRRKKEEENRKHQRIQTPKNGAFNKRDLNFFKNSKNSCTAYHFLPPKNPCSLNSLTCHITPYSMTLHTSGALLVTSQIREGKY